jgi:NTE family protein
MPAARRGLRWWIAACAAALVACTEQPATLPRPGEEPVQAPQTTPAKLALVLSSGGLRGLAHVGVLQALEAEGIRPDLIVGSSVGALVGAVHASGRSADELRPAGRSRGLRLWHHLAARQCRAPPAIGARLRRACTCGASASSASRQPSPPSRPICRPAACRSSTSAARRSRCRPLTGLPGVFAATPIDGRPFADGGLSSPVPVRVARALGARRVIAVDVTYPPSESRLDGLVDRLFQIGLVMSHVLAAQETHWRPTS